MLTLALGVGTTASVFTIVDGVLLRALPYADPARIAMVWTTDRGAAGAPTTWPLSAGFVPGLRADARSFESLAAFRAWSYTIDDAAEPEQVAGARVASDLFRVLGVRPRAGRTFTEDESRPARPMSR